MARSGKFQRYNTRGSKTTADKVVEIRRLYAEYNWSQSRLSVVYGLHINTIGRIVRGETWQAIETVQTDQEIADQEYAEQMAVRGRVSEMDKARMLEGQEKAMEVVRKREAQEISGELPKENRLGARFVIDPNAKIEAELAKRRAGQPPTKPIEAPLDANDTQLERLKLDATKQRQEHPNLAARVDDALEAFKDSGADAPKTDDKTEGT